jgi:CBS domain containing-hemolysin-like protein
MMSVEVIVDLILIGLFFCGSWFFSGFESGMISVNRHRLIHFVRHGDSRARRLAMILKDSHRLLATTLVGNNICNVTLSTLGSSVAIALTASFMSEGWAQVMATVTVGALLLIIGEFLPKLWFSARPIVRCGKVLGIFVFFRAILYPLASFCMLMTRLVTVHTKKEKRSPFVSRETITFLMRDSEAHGQVSAFERMMVNRVLDLHLRKASQLMTPMRRVVKVYESDNLATVQRVFRQCKHRIVLMMSDDETQVLGFLHLFDLLRSRSRKPVPFDLRRPSIYVRDDLPVDELLPYMRVRNTKILIVCQGNKPVGIVTQQDVLNAILDDELLHSSTDRRSRVVNDEDDE